MHKQLNNYVKELGSQKSLIDHNFIEIFHFAKNLANTVPIAWPVLRNEHIYPRPFRTEKRWCLLKIDRNHANFIVLSCRSTMPENLHILLNVIQNTWLIQIFTAHQGGRWSHSTIKIAKWQLVDMFKKYKDMARKNRKDPIFKFSRSFNIYTCTLGLYMPKHTT